MRKDLKNVSSRYDLVVVGAGICGLVFLNRVLEKGYSGKIAVFESGSMLSPQPYPRKKFVRATGIRIKNTSRYFGVGGGSNVWGPIHGLYNPKSVDSAFREGTFPFDFEEYVKYVDLASKSFGTPSSSYFESPKRIGQGLLARPFVKNRRPIKFSKFSSVLEAKNIDYFELADVTSIQANTDCDEVNIYCTRTKQNFRTRANYTVLAAGTLENIRILHNSFYPKIDGIGSNFMSHPKGLVGSCYGKVESFHQKILETQDEEFIKYYGLASEAHFGISSYVKISQGLQFKFIYKYTYLLSDLITISNNVYLKSFLKIFLKLFTIFSKKIQILTKGYFVSLEVFVNMSPSRDNIVRICSSGQLEIQHTISEHEYDQIHELVRSVCSALNFGTIPRLSKNSLKKDLFRDGSHHLGGLSSVGPDAIVDCRTCKAVPLYSTYILGGGVVSFPEVVNPTLTFIATTLKIADTFIMDVIPND